MAVFVLDTSALLTVLNQEEGSEIVLSLLDRGKSGQDVIYLPFMVLMKLEYLLLEKVSSEETMAILTLVRAWSVEVSESTEEWRHQAAMVKSQSPLSVADAWVASLAFLNRAELVHKDPEYERVNGLQMIKLPYKN